MTVALDDIAIKQFDNRIELVGELQLRQLENQLRHVLGCWHAVVNKSINLRCHSHPSEAKPTLRGAQPMCVTFNLLPTKPY